MANIITSCRILCSVMLLFFPVQTPLFFTFYLLAGFSDMIDGTVARKTHTDSKAGARLDSIADFIFIVVCLYKFIPIIQIPLWLYSGIAITAIAKAVNIIVGLVKNKHFIVEHSALNKVTGFLLFCIPFTLTFLSITYSGGIVCIIAIAALQEYYYIKHNRIIR